MLKNNLNDSNVDFLDTRQLFLYSSLLYLFKNKTGAVLNISDNYNFRNIPTYVIPKGKKDIFHKSFQYIAPKCFNKLPNDFHLINSKNVFKREIKKFILSTDLNEFFR